MKNTVAILYICIGKYIAFWKDFYQNFESLFLPEFDKEYFVFTDVEELDGEGHANVHRIEQADLGWPGNTLFRFEMFLSVLPELETVDYIFFMNANVLCQKLITGDMILPLHKELVVVQHPAYYNKKPYEFEYEFHRSSNAYIPRGKGEVYICGGINGGKKEAYMELIKKLANNVRADYNKGIIARWHDESHINRYIIGREDYRLLTPSFCYPEGWDLPFEPILLVQEKSKKIQLDASKEARQRAKSSVLGKAADKIARQWWKLYFFLTETGGKDGR